MIRLLLLAGTAEARALSTSVQGVELVTSLAGVTAETAIYGGQVRRGGFGGVAGLARYLSVAGIDAVVDATHPFAEQISRHAVLACRSLDLPLLRLERRPWSAEPGDSWFPFESLNRAVGALPPGAVGFVAAGRSAATILPPHHVRLILRTIEAPKKVAKRVMILRARPPFPVADETRLFRAHGVTHLLCKNAGGSTGFTKLRAARALQLPVHMVTRPPQLKVPHVENVRDALEWITCVAKPTPGGAQRA
ncbi:MAG: cobalt-precorrin-6A reductase [Pseudomonadota bacterium]